MVAFRLNAEQERNQPLLDELYQFLISLHSYTKTSCQQLFTDQQRKQLNEINKTEQEIKTRLTRAQKGSKNHQKLMRLLRRTQTTRRKLRTEIQNSGIWKTHKNSVQTHHKQTRLRLQQLLQLLDRGQGTLRADTVTLPSNKWPKKRFGFTQQKNLLQQLAATFATQIRQNSQQDPDLTNALGSIQAAAAASEIAEQKYLARKPTRK